ncbi:MAG: DUF2461 family protein, partial [Oscillospiraceae bacterium]|nr:DUF2461 family protein [Oscillospiraceae bacterium]
SDCLEGTHFEMYGDKYKRSKFPDRTQAEREWLDRKTIGIQRRRTDWENIFSEGFADETGKELTAVKPFYDFLLKTAYVGMKRQ